MIYFQAHVDRLLKAKDEQIERLQKAYELDRDRANAAVDALLTKAGVNRITPFVVTMPKQAQDLLAEVSLELGNIGKLDDDEPKEAAKK